MASNGLKGIKELSPCELPTKNHTILHGLALGMPFMALDEPRSPSEPTLSKPASPAPPAPPPNYRTVLRGPEGPPPV